MRRPRWCKLRFRYYLVDQVDNGLACSWLEDGELQVVVYMYTCLQCQSDIVVLVRDKQAGGCN